MTWRGRVQAKLTAEKSDLWVFGYGSLMWKPDFAYTDMLEARLFGFHRAPCVFSWHHRGTENNPGLVMGLDAGGSCRGRILRVKQSDAPAVMDYLHEREMISGVYKPTLRTLHMAKGRVEKRTALCFVTERKHVQYAGGLDFETQVKLIRNGIGPSGKCVDYFAETIAHMDELGIADGPLHKLLAAVQKKS
ncbi:MAG: gamma-glutamylcyclotransferase [Alphaproteobacteria bacterium]|jgi:glutathione-specific gamma-glutamylcyclotransferase|nr:gamma-glutamylcyclotransferase [Alphaproteobacteria bacterium]MBT4017671.1 gamma-glutamylcyclotransferase [Alphaproteobacteria bacterium]MBT4964803.1 gamma-glutamylcyclotransferase [Alphaproteobacteria bacterium]MBT5162129.1 gamma-glutamylcyclotransferase [Alphaproteobacteria bacterium]MBT5919413.1 gamma-glutamylcyclotransferase [Alphaproteobacteria bacterium]